jgi:hypothetical protein
MNNPPPSGNGSIAVYGQDAPVASVVSFQLTLMGLTASDGVNTTTLLSTPQTVDFARLTGLRTLLDLNSAPAGTYTSVTLTLANPVIGYLNVTGGAPPTISMLNGTLTNSTVTVLLNPPLVIADNDLNGLRLDFDLHQSLQVDVNGQITGTVVPTFDIGQVPPDNVDAEIDDLRGSVVSADPASNSFVMQIPNGKQVTVQIGSSTVTDSGDTLSTFTNNTIVQVSGELNRVTRMLQADEVCVISQDHFFAGGLITNVQPATGPATQLDLFVRDELPSLPTVQPDTIASFSLNGSEKYLIYRLNLPITQLLFNNSSLIAPQAVTVGGPVSNNTPTIHRVVLHRQGVSGPWITGSTTVQNGNTGTFQMQEKGIVGVLLSGPLTVLTSNNTQFIGLSGLSALSGNQAIPLHVVGLLLQDPATNPPAPVFVANRWISDLAPRFSSRGASMLRVVPEDVYSSSLARRWALQPAGMEGGAEKGAAPPE